ncbi:A-kinase anchor protein 8-like [Pseudophryne corroboree]|uniref:A-kinase anchor protein 8-like n=1 Tax=Pseudophryne corroboree TaxID=495146 RepID=UPI003081E081
MDGRRGGGYSGRGRYPGGDGYGAYDYTYDYGSNPTSSYSSASESWMTSFPQSDGATLMGSARESLYDRTDRTRYGYSEPQRGYGNWRKQCPPRPAQQGWGGGSRGGFRSNFGSPDAARGAGRPVPLLSPGALPEVAGFQGLKAFTGNSYFGGGFKPRTRNNWKERTAKKKIVKDGGAPPEKKIRTTSEDNGAKSGSSDSEKDEDAEGAGKTKGDDKEEEQEEATKDGKERKQTPVKNLQETQSKRLRDRMVDRIQFVCSLCKFRTFYDEEMASHLQSAFHKEHFDYVGGKLPKQSADFLQEYVLDKSNKTEERRKTIEDLSKTIQQIYRDLDLTQDLGMEHFVKKVEAAHCAACDVFIPMNSTTLQRHLNSPLHNQNRRSMMENSKKTALAVARSILNNKVINQKLESYIKGQNPFTDEYKKNTKSGISTKLALEVQETEREDLPPSSALSDSEKDDNSLQVVASEEACDGKEKEEDIVMQCENSEETSDRQEEEQVNADDPTTEETSDRQEEEQLNTDDPTNGQERSEVPSDAP